LRKAKEKERGNFFDDLVEAAQKHHQHVGRFRAVLQKKINKIMTEEEVEQSQSPDEDLPQTSPVLVRESSVESVEENQTSVTKLFKLPQWTKRNPFKQLKKFRQTPVENGEILADSERDNLQQAEEKPEAPDTHLHDESAARETRDNFTLESSVSGHHIIGPMSPLGTPVGETSIRVPTSWPQKSVSEAHIKSHNKRSSVRNTTSIADVDKCDPSSAGVDGNDDKVDSSDESVISVAHETVMSVKKTVGATSVKETVMSIKRNFVSIFSKRPSHPARQSLSIPQIKDRTSQPRSSNAGDVVNSVTSDEPLATVAQPPQAQGPPPNVTNPTFERII
jgi:hypothetical protein